MNVIYRYLGVVVLLLTIISCSTDVEHKIAAVVSPILVSSTPVSGATGIHSGNVTISLTYDKKVFFASKNKDLLSISHNGSIVSADVIGSSSTLVVVANCPSRNTTYTLSVPEAVVTGANSVPAPSVEIHFTTQELDNTPVNSLTIEAQECIISYRKPMKRKRFLV